MNTLKNRPESLDELLKHPLLSKKTLRRASVDANDDEDEMAKAASHAAGKGRSARPGQWARGGRKAARPAPVDFRGTLRPPGTPVDPHFPSSA